MATKRKRGSTWEYVFRRKGLMPKPKSFTFDSEKEGDRFAEQAEALLNAGVLPPGFETVKTDVDKFGDVIREYIRSVCIKADDDAKLRLIEQEHGETPLREITYSWAEDWIRSYKIVKNVAPSTIRKYKGALERCLKWAVNKGYMSLNPLAILPTNYAQYNEYDSMKVKPKEDNERDRRLESGEEKAIRKVLDGHKPEGKQRSIDEKHVAAKKCLFELALESAMRMREMYTLTTDQIDIPNATIFLDKTKNGSKRQVPMTTVAIRAIQDYMEKVKRGDEGMEGFKIASGGLIFPWWDGKESSLNATTSRVSRAFGSIFSLAGLNDFRFHDLRHEATSRFFEKTNMSDVEISHITGHKRMEMLRRYANLRASQLAKKLW